MASCSDLLLWKYVEQALMDDDQDVLAGGGGSFLDPLSLQAAERSFHQVLNATPYSGPRSRVDDYAQPEIEAEGESVGTGAEAERTVSLLSPNSSTNGSLIASSDYNLSGSDSILQLQFQRGVEEANRFLPQGDIGPSWRPKPLRKKCRLNADTAEESRTQKQSAACVVEGDELSELFERLFLCPDVVTTTTTSLDPPSATASRGNRQSQKGSHRVVSLRNQENKYEVVDLENLLLRCARAVAADDSRKTIELLKQIRRFSSPTGDGSQRLSHYFADGIEARFFGPGTQLYIDNCTRLLSAEGMLKLYEPLLTACPFRKLTNHLATLYILKLAEKTTTLHIIDFGFLHGFQWPMVIQHLSTRPGGPPKLRITAIELPMSASTPTELLDQARNLVTNYCHRFNVPLQFSGISQKWETVKIEDLKVEPDETIVVNCLFRLEKLRGETDEVNSPRAVVVNLIRDIKPHMFIHGILNGSLNTPLFFPRFREALYNYSAWFDMLDGVFDRDSEVRMVLEKEVYGWEVMNVTAFEGAHRVMRPETCKQCQVRNTRAGFKLVALEEEYMEKIRAQMEDYHEDFLLDEDGYWVLMGWKGRVLVAVSFWVPAPNLS